MKSKILAVAALGGLLATSMVFADEPEMLADNTTATAPTNLASNNIASMNAPAADMTTNPEELTPDTATGDDDY